MNAEACSGYDLVEKTEMQDERIGKIYMGFCSVFITVVMVVFSIIWPPVLLDVPEYLSGTGEVVTGTITEFTDKIRPVEGEWTSSRTLPEQRFASISYVGDDGHQ